MRKIFSDESLQRYPFLDKSVPRNWEISSLTNLAAEICPGFASGQHNSVGSGVPHLRPMNISRAGQIDLTVVKSVPHLRGIELNAGDILFNNTNSPELIGKTAIISSREEGFAFSNHMTRIRLPEEVNTKFVAKQLYFLWMSGYFKHRCVKHVNQASISSDWLARTIPILLPPIREQARIADKVEELLSNLDTAIAGLERIKANLKRYRASVLQAAVEGRLTAEWRKKNPPNETGAELLARLLKERRAKWEENQLKKYAEQGKTPPKNWKEKYPEPVKPETTGLPELPDEWVWGTLSQIGFLDRGKSKHRPRNAPILFGGPYPFIQTGDVRHSNTFISDFKQTYSEAGLAQSKLWPKGTLCITIAANIAETGILAMPACFPDSIVGYIPSSSTVLVRYIEAYIRTIRSKLESFAPATAQKNINLEVLWQVAIPIMSADEQKQIISDIDDRLSIADFAEKAVDNILQRASRLRQSILKRAFEGRLVPQDPNDEPASVLLEYIRAERLNQAATVKPARTRRKRKDDAN